jgi:hypothetical protein
LAQVAVKFQPRNLRKLEGDHPMQLRNDKGMTFILVKTSGAVQYATDRGDKDALVADYDEKAGDLLMLAWTGHWKTDVFELTRAELERRYAAK